MTVVGGKQEVDKEIALGMCQATWKIMLTALSQLLARSSSEEIVLHLLKVGPDPHCMHFSTRKLRVATLIEIKVVPSLRCQVSHSEVARFIGLAETTQVAELDAAYLSHAHLMRCA